MIYTWFPWVPSVLTLKVVKEICVQGREERKRRILRSGDLDATKRFIGFPSRPTDRLSWKTNGGRDERDGGEMRSSQAIQRLLKGKARETLGRFGACNLANCELGS